MQILILDEILFEIASDNHYGQQIIQHQKESIQSTKERIKVLKKEGKNPDEFTVPFKFNPSQ